MITVEVQLATWRTTRAGPASTLAPQGKCLWGVPQAFLATASLPSDQTNTKQAEKVQDGPETSYTIRQGKAQRNHEDMSKGQRSQPGRALTRQIWDTLSITMNKWIINLYITRVHRSLLSVNGREGKVLAFSNANKCWRNNGFRNKWSMGALAGLLSG